MKKFLELNNLIKDYLQVCSARRNLDYKTIKSYSTDLQQYKKFNDTASYNWIDKTAIQKYIEYLHTVYKPKSIKRKVASLKAFFHYLEIEELININPFHKLQFKYKEPFILPKTIPINTIEQIIAFAYSEYKNQTTRYGKKNTLQNVLILELLFATGMRISELCQLTLEEIVLHEYIIKIHGKGSKERLIQICNKSIQTLLDAYIRDYYSDTNSHKYIFTNRLHNRLSEQSVRNMINKYTKNAGVNIHITPHMFRHSFATLLLEEDVDIRYIQQMLGHSSITTTQIYTHISISKQKDILSTKHPRNKFDFNHI